jgi:hypothetical protein
MLRLPRLPWLVATLWLLLLGASYFAGAREVLAAVIADSASSDLEGGNIWSRAPLLPASRCLGL